MTDNDKIELELATAAGKATIRGIRSSNLIGLATLIAAASISFLLWRVVTTLGEHAIEAHASWAEVTVAIKEAAKSNRMQTCILSVSQEKREQEYMSPNGFCKQMSILP